MLLSVEESIADAKKAPEVPGGNIFDSLDKVDDLPSSDIGSACESSHQALIFSPYGGLVNHDKVLYFTFSEAKFNDGGYELPNSDNFLVLKLNPVTGRISYFDPYAD